MADKVLIVGGDSFVARYLVKEFKNAEYDVYVTTRRKSSCHSKRLYLSFEDVSSYELGIDFSLVIIVASVTGYDECSTNYMANIINTELIPKFALHMLEKNSFVVYISSNSVFGGNIPWPGENDMQRPYIPYALQKHDAEIVMKIGSKLLGKERQFSIIRLTKVLDSTVPPIPSWFAKWSENQIVYPFVDLIFAPLSVQYAAKSIVRIAVQKISGNFHLSGANNISYFMFAKMLAEKCEIGFDKISPTTSVKMGIKIPFLPKFSGLGMKQTMALTGIKPQHIDNVINDILNCKGESYES